MNERAEIIGTQRHSTLPDRSRVVTVLIDGGLPVAIWPHDEGNIFVVDAQYSDWMPTGREAIYGPADLYWPMSREQAASVYAALEEAR